MRKGELRDAVAHRTNTDLGASEAEKPVLPAREGNTRMLATGRLECWKEGNLGLCADRMNGVLRSGQSLFLYLDT